jgi:predicted DCC family thiol-disulfide oxidoreductase YuxK
VNSEISKLKDSDWLRGWVLYDGECELCRRWAGRFERTLTLRGFDLAPLQSPWVLECLDIPEEELLARMRVLTCDGRDLAGADALMFITRTIWWAWPLYAVSLLPGCRSWLRRAYDWLAVHRRCTGGTCKARVRPIMAKHLNSRGPNRRRNESA